MRLSDMNKYQLYDALCTIVVPFSHILEDKELGQALAPLKHEADTSVYMEKLCQTIIEYFPKLFQRYRGDLITVLTALTGEATGDIQHTPDDLIVVELRELVDDALGWVTTIILIFGRDEILAALYRYGPPESVDMLVSLLRVQNRERHLLGDIAEKAMQIKKGEVNQ